VPADDPRVPPLRLLQGDAGIRAGDPGGALDRLAALPVDLAPAVADSAVALVRAAARAADAATLTARVQALPARHPFAAALLAGQARALYNEGERDEARAAAEAARAAGAAGDDARVAQVVLEDSVDESLGITGPVTVIGVLLTRTGPPSLTSFSALVEEGVRAAAQATSIAGRIEIVVQDDRGTPEGAAAGMRALEEAGAVAVIGPLEGAGLSAASLARTRPVPLVSPTAEADLGDPNVYTLGGFDPQAARALARWAVGAGLRRVALLYPRGGEPEQEALAFEQAFAEAGGAVIGRIPYDFGTTYFETQMRSVEGLRPDAVVLPLPPEEIETLAPQIAYFGIDTLDIRVLGTGGWTRSEVLSAVAPRHTNGVVAVTPVAAEDGSAALVRAYESLYRRTLRSAVPAVGFDAASLVLQALRTGARSPQALGGALEQLDSFPGATGQLGVADGRVVRGHRVVCIQESRLLPIGESERPVLVDRRPPPGPDGVRPEYALDGTPVMVLCPGVEPPAGFR
jgi:ABC-type branched-subunit amino acid transport system substrate-binding protein